MFSSGSTRRSHLTDMEEERSLFENIINGANTSELITNRAEGGSTKRRSSVDDLSKDVNNKRNKIFEVDEDPSNIDSNSLEAVVTSSSAGPAAALAWDYNDFPYSNSIPMGLDDSFYQGSSSNINNRVGIAIAEMDLLAQLGAALNQLPSVLNNVTSSSSQSNLLSENLVQTPLDPQLFPDALAAEKIRQDEASYGGNSRDALEGMVKLYGEGVTTGEEREPDLIVTLPNAPPIKRGKGGARALAQRQEGIQVDNVLSKDSIVETEETIAKPRGKRPKKTNDSTSADRTMGPLLDLAIPTAKQAAAAFHGNEDNPHACVVTTCNKTFARKSDYLRHYRIHSGERPFVCDFEGCGKDFVQHSALTVHARSHSGEKPHQCDQCKREFSDSSSLARHRKVHAGIKPYKCLQCGTKAFSRKATLTRHGLVCSGNLNSAKKARSVNKRLPVVGTTSNTSNSTVVGIESGMALEDDEEEEDEEEGDDELFSDDLEGSIPVASTSKSNKSNGKGKSRVNGNAVASGSGLTSSNKNDLLVLSNDIPINSTTRSTSSTTNNTKGAAKATSATRTQVKPVPRPSAEGRAATEEEAVALLNILF